MCACLSWKFTTKRLFLFALVQRPLIDLFVPRAGDTPKKQQQQTDQIRDLLANPGEEPAQLTIRESVDGGIMVVGLSDHTVKRSLLHTHTHAFR
jgi:hypothetical protein